MTDGKLITGGPRPAIRFERHLPDPPAVVWQAITDREELKAWFPCDVTVSGGRWRWDKPVVPAQARAAAGIRSPDLPAPGAPGAPAPGASLPSPLTPATGAPPPIRHGCRDHVAGTT